MFDNDPEFREVVHAPPPRPPQDDSAYLLSRARSILRHENPAHRELAALHWENRELRADLHPAPLPRPAGESDAGRGVSPGIDSTPSPPLLDSLSEFVEQLHSAQIAAIKRSNNAH